MKYVFIMILISFSVSCVTTQKIFDKDLDELSVDMATFNKRMGSYFYKEVIKKNPEKILAYQYDFVLNGCEIGGGSIRTHDPDILASVFEAMGNQPEEIKEKFGHMLEAFSYGVPPHGGIAPGIDRLVMVLEIEPNIREVIAFPKTGDGRDLMMHSPGPADEKQLKELGIQIIKKDK